MAVTHKFSARILHFPRRCCNCCAADPRSVWSATFTRVTGVRVVREDSREWEFPICNQCLRWMEAEEELTGKLRAARLKGSTYLALCAVSGGSIWFSSYAMTYSPFLPQVVIGILFGAALYMFGLAVASLVPGVYMSGKRAMKKVEGMADEVEAMQPDGAASVDEPVEYLGWNGSVHAFRFANAEYADLMRAANVKKWVR